MAKRADDEREIARLYALPLDEFTGERDAAAKRLREAGDADAAKRVKALRKPNAPAGAINRAVASDRDATDGLIAAGEQLEAAQSDALAGGDAGALREAMAEHGEAVERLMEAVVRELGGAGGSGAVDRARETLRAVAGDGELRAEVAGGTLVRDREGVGFGGAVVAPTPRAKGKSKAAKGATKPKTARGSKEPAKATKPKGPTAAERKRAQAAVRRAERSMDAAAKRLEQAERRLDRARRGVADAEAEVDDAAREHSEREDELAKARDAVA